MTTFSSAKPAGRPTWTDLRLPGLCLRSPAGREQPAPADQAGRAPVHVFPDYSVRCRSVRSRCRRSALPVLPPAPGRREQPRYIREVCFELSLSVLLAIFRTGLAALPLSPSAAVLVCVEGYPDGIQDI